jgi:hypothetical protein
MAGETEKRPASTSASLLRLLILVLLKQHCSVTESKVMDEKPAAGICHNYNPGGYKKPAKPEPEKEKESSTAPAAPIA